MIISKLKDKKDILEMLGNSKKIFIIGCSECAAVCKSGGEEEVKMMSEFLIRNQKELTGGTVVESPCIEAKIKMALIKNKKGLNLADTVLVLACGLGTQMVDSALYGRKKIKPGTDTLFAGGVFGRQDNFAELCSLCGECLLDKTEAVCPYTRCAKGLLNGPCGGNKNGRCEVDRERDCAWILIFKKFKQAGREEALLEIIPPKNYSKKGKPGSLKLN